MKHMRHTGEAGSGVRGTGTTDAGITDAGTTGGPPAEEGAATASAALARRLAACRGAERMLTGNAFLETVRERLDRLVAEAQAVYDLDSRPDFYGDDDSIVGELETPDGRDPGHRGRRLLPDRHDGPAGGAALLGGAHGQCNGRRTSSVASGDA